MNIDVKTLSKITANCIQQYNNRIINHDEVRFILGYKDNLVSANELIHYGNKIKDKNPMFNLVDAQKIM